MPSRSDLAKRINKFHEVLKQVLDFLFTLNVLEVDTNTMTALPGLVEQFPLKAADAVHLSAALWLRDMCRLVPDFAAGDTTIEFGVADQRLARVAAQYGCKVFNPEA